MEIAVSLLPGSTDTQLGALGSSSSLQDQGWEQLMTAGSSADIKSVSSGFRPSRIEQPQGRQEEKAISSLYSSPWMAGLALGYLLAP